MLTEANLKENLIEATFVNDDRTIIEVLFTSEDKQKVQSAIIEFDTKHPDFQELMKVISVDDLHEMTWQKKKDERASFENEVKLIAENEGLIKKIGESVNSDFFKSLFDFLLNDDKEHIDRLFNFKIFIFEQDCVKTSKNEAVKTAIRKSKTPLEAVKGFITLWEESNQSTNQTNQTT
tara:strand:+ start:34 stop:567 length:534 start_codon:yes stop_codon:yes gene_type:complete